MTNMLNNFFLGSLYFDDELSELLSDQGCLEAIIHFESSLAKIQGKIGIIPKSNSESIQQTLNSINLTQINFQNLSTNDGIIIPELIKELKQKFLNNEDSQYLHWGVTSQDVIDTARCLILLKYFNLFEKRLNSFLILGSEKALLYKYLAIPARTRGQIATITSLGSKFSLNFIPILNQKTKLLKLKPHILKLSLGGASGTSNSFGGYSEILVKELANELNLSAPKMSWHNNRECFIELASVLTIITSSFGKFGSDTLLLNQTEIQEIELSDPGKSSAMPHKKNPIKAESLIALADINHSLNVIMGSTMVHRNERDGVAWTKELIVFEQILYTTAVACKIGLELLDSIKPREDNINRTIERTNGLIFTENVLKHLLKHYEKNKAELLLSNACKNVETNDSTLLFELRKIIDPKIDLSKAFDPVCNLGDAPKMVDRFYYKVNKK